MESLATAIANLLVENGTVSEEDKPLYAFGLHQLWITILNVATAILLGAVTGQLWQCALFLVAYIPLRRLVGGYHAKTEMRCYVASTLLLACALALIRLIPQRLSVLLPLLLLFSAAILLMAPVDCKNKPLDATEYMVYRGRSRQILAIHVLGAFAAVFFTALEIVAVIVVADAVLTFLLVLGLTTKQTERRKQKR